MMKKGYLASIILVSLVIGLSFFSGATANQFTPSPTNLTVYYIDVGQGDSEFIRSPDGYTMLIDAGPSSTTGGKVTDLIHSLNITNIDIVMATHSDADHIGGMSYIIDHFPIQAFIDSPYPNTPWTATYTNMRNKINQSAIPYYTTISGDYIPFDPSVNISVLNPQTTPFSDVNDNSIVFKMLYEQTSFLFMGDAETHAENAILASGVNIQSDVLKVGHHGSDTSSSANFLSHVLPQISIIEVGANNSFGHPAPITLVNLLNVGSTIYRTDLNGTVMVTTDGEHYTVITEFPVLPPAANFSANQTSGISPLTVLFTDTSTGSSPFNYQWNFGDGSGNATGQNPTHTFNTTTNQTFTVVLTVSNDLGTSSKTGFITVNVPPSQFTINATSGPDGSIEPSGLVGVMNGTNQSFVITPAPGHLSCFGGGTLFVVWNLTVDGQPVDIGPEPSTVPINYTFTDVEANHTIHAEFAELIIDARPQAKFTANTTSGPVPLVVNFSQVLVSNNTGLLWSFGDNSTSTDQNPIHVYEIPGLYTVSLTIYCDNESFTEEKPDYISVSGPPVANFTMNTTIGMVPLSVLFTDTSTGSPPLTYLWDFGDNSSSTEQNPTHTYTSPGSYLVNLTVNNSIGVDTKTADQPIVVLGPIGGDQGFFLVHCNVDGSSVFFDDSFKGMTENGTLLVQVYTTAAPYHMFTVEKEGYQTFSAPITKYPGKDETVDLYANLTPFEAVHATLGNGWNLFSTPVTLDPNLSTLQSVFNDTEREKINIVYGWNGNWFIPGQTYSLKPLESVYIKVNGSATANLVPSMAVTPPPSKSVSEGINLIGSAPGYVDGVFQSMPLDQAFISINQSQGGDTGYVIVISPGLNQPGWAYPRGGTIQNIEPFKGYWVVMENPDTLFGFSTTPLSQST